MPSVTQHCLGTSRIPAAEKANPALVSGSDRAKENVWAVCVGRILSYPLSLPFNVFAYQQLPLIFPVTCWDFPLSLHFWDVFSSYGIVPYKASETGFPVHLCVHIASAGPFHIFIPGISSSDTCSHSQGCCKDIFSTLLIWNRLSLSIPQLPFLLNMNHLSLFSRPFLMSLTFFVYYWNVCLNPWLVVILW